MKKLFKEKVNKALLKRMYKMDSPSCGESAFKSFLHKFIKRNFDITPTYDKKGNMYITKGEPEDGLYPCIVAHCDEVSRHAPRGKDFVVLEANNKIFGMSTDSMSRHGLGADDKNGIWIALNMLEMFEDIKVAFFVEEEIGDRGSHAADMSFFKDVKFVLEADRKSGGDFIINAAGTQIASQDFADKLPLKQFGYKVVDGGLTDVVALSENGLNVCSCNMSCGYYNPHQETEYTDFKQLENCMLFVEQIIVTLQGKQTFDRSRQLQKQVVEQPRNLNINASKAKQHQFDLQEAFDAYDDYFEDLGNVGFELESYFDGTCPDAIEDTWRAVENDYAGRISRELFEYAYDDYCIYNGMEPHFHAEELLYSEEI